MVCFKALASILATVSAAQAAQLLNFENKQDVVANSYLVMMHDGMSAHDFKTHVEATAKACHVNAKRDGSIVGGVKHKYDVNGWRGYSGTFDKATLEALTNDPNVRENRAC